MNTSVYLILLCIGTVTALDHFILFEREPGDRPIYIQTLQTIETEEFSHHFVAYEWFGANETFTQLYIEVSTVVNVSVNYPDNPNHPLYRRNIKLQVGASETETQLTVSFILFGFVNQPPTNPGSDITLLGTAPNMGVYELFNEV